MCVDHVASSVLPPASTTSTDKASPLAMDHLINVTDSLRDLNNEQIIKVGAKLGLSFPALQRMKTLPEDMVAAWLREEDKVTITSGPPSWISLVTALEAVGQMGIASKIRKGEIWYLTT